MYCKICGCKIKSGINTCPECGSMSSTEFCGGFWGLVEEYEKKQKADVSAGTGESGNGCKSVEAPAEEDVKNQLAEAKKKLSASRKKMKKLKNGMVVCAALAVVFFVATVVQSVRVGTVNDNLGKEQTKNARLMGRYKKLNEENIELNKLMEELTQPELTPEPVPEISPEPTQEATVEPTAESTQESTPESASEPTAEPTPESTPDSTSPSVAASGTE